MSAVVDGATIHLSIPAAPAGATPLASITIGSVLPLPAFTPTSQGSIVTLAIAISASDTAGNAVSQLAAPMGLAISFVPSHGYDPYSAVLYTADLNGPVETLATVVVANGDGSYTASASTLHLSLIELVASPPLAIPTETPTTPATAIYQIYLPVVATGTIAGW